MKLSKAWSPCLAGLALLCLMPWSVQAESDKPARACKGKDCVAARVGKTQEPSAAKLDKNAGATNATSGDDSGGDAGLRSKNALGPSKLLTPAASAARGANKGAVKNVPAGKSQSPRDPGSR